MKPPFADREAAFQRIDGSALKAPARHVLMNMIRLADENGFGEPGVEHLAKVCGCDRRTITRTLKVLRGNASPVQLRITANRYKPPLAKGDDPIRITDSYQLAWRAAGQIGVYPLGDKLSSTPKSSRKARGTICPAPSNSPSFIKERGKATAPIDEKETRRTEGLTPTVAEDDGRIAVAAFVPGADHDALAADLELDAVDACAAFVAWYSGRGDTWHHPEEWATFYTGWLNRRPAALRRSAARVGAGASRAARSGRGQHRVETPAAAPPTPVTSCAINPELWPAVLVALGNWQGRGWPLADCVIKDMHEVASVRRAVAAALGQPDDCAFDPGHAQAVRDYIEQLEREHVA